MTAFCWTRALVLALLSFALAGSADAHSPDLSTAKLTLRDGGYDVEIAFLKPDIDRMLTETASEHEGVDMGEPVAREAEISRFVSRRLVMRRADGSDCRARPSHAEPNEGNEKLLNVKLRFDCPGGEAFTVYDPTDLIAAQGSRGKHFVEVISSENGGQILLDRSSPPVDLTKPLENTWEVMQRFTLHGVAHILTGYDHICFLIAVILWATRAWAVVKIVTAFTISHSITLSLAALDIVVLPTTLTEAAIALSIVYVAMENFFSREVDRRWRDTFFFGFIHGFGFASGLKELNMQQKAIVPALASFNIGVEFGQIVIVLLLMPLLWLIDRATGKRRSKKLVWSLSAFIALFGAYWFFQRVGILAGKLR